MTKQIPSPIAAFLKAIHAPESRAFLACFADDAIVVDALREFSGLAAIKGWSDREVLVGNVTLGVRSVREHYGDYIVVTEVDGDFDKTNLPNPLLITNHFTLRGEKIVKLICLLMKAPGTSLEEALAAKATA